MRNTNMHTYKSHKLTSKRPHFDTISARCHTAYFYIYKSHKPASKRSHFDTVKEVKESVYNSSHLRHFVY